MNWLQTLLTGSPQKSARNTPVTARATMWGSHAVAQFEPPLLELTRTGMRYGGGLQIIANAIASVQAIPTTAPTAILYNADPAKSLTIDSIGHFLASGTADVGSTLLAAVSKPIVAASIPAAMTTGWGVGSLSNSSRGSSVLWATAVSIPAGAVFQAVHANTQAAAATVGSGGNPASLFGGMIVPPGCALAFSILSGAGTVAKYGIYAAWSELPLDLE